MISAETENCLKWFHFYKFYIVVSAINKLKTYNQKCNLILELCDTHVLVKIEILYLQIYLLFKKV